MRYHETFYGIEVDHWVEDYPSSSTVFSSNHYVMTKNFISDGASTTSVSVASVTNKFLYPHHISKTYFIEGVISGQITLGASGATSTVTNYRVTLCKIDETDTETELFTTGWVTVNDTLDWDTSIGTGIGQERVYPFWIDAWEYEKLDEFERIYIKIQVTCDANCVLWHSNDATWEDLKIEIPLRM